MLNLFTLAEVPLCEFTQMLRVERSLCCSCECDVFLTSLYFWDDTKLTDSLKQCRISQQPLTKCCMVNLFSLF